MANDGKGSGPALPRLTPIGDATPYGVVWYENGHLLVRGFARYDDAAEAYDTIIQRSKRDKAVLRTSVYLVITLASYESG